MAGRIGGRMLAAALGALLGGACLAAAAVRPVAIAATGDQVLVAYQALGRTWLLPRSPRAAWVLPLPGEPEGVTLVGGSGALFAIAGGEARQLIWPAASPQGRPATEAVGVIGPDPVRRALAADLDDDGLDELLLLRGDPVPLPESRSGLAGRLEVWQVQGESLRLRWQGLEKYAPWQLAAGDLDRDGNVEWAIGVWTKAVYDPVWAERPWLYHWKDGQPYAIWLGSRLAHPFSDFAITPPAPGRPPALVALEAARDGGQTLSLYRWNGFGFSLEVPGPSWPAVAAFLPLPLPDGCAEVAAVVSPGPTLLLLDTPVLSGGSLREVARHALPGGTGSIQLAAAAGRLWVLLDGHLSHFDICPSGRR